MRLSICIATYKRAETIGETLASIVPQLTDDVEVVVFDGASPDHTAEVVREFAERHPAIRYIRAETNSGIDADFDNAVSHAGGAHCWLFSDDDTLAPGAVAAVLNELEEGDPDLLVVDAEVRDRELDRVFERRRLPFTGRRVYQAGDANRMMADLGEALSFIGSTIVRRATWMARDRRSYYGTLFVHMGMIYQMPPLRKVVAVARALVRIRIANAMWTGRGFEIWMFLWPELIWGFSGYSDEAKCCVVARRPWMQPQKLLVWRAHGVYGLPEFHKHLGHRATGIPRLTMMLIAALPGTLAHPLVVVLLVLKGHSRASSMYQLVEGSRFSSRFSRWLACLGGYGYPTHAR